MTNTDIAAEQNIFALLLDFFNGNEKKVWLWLETPNPLLGDVVPNFMVEIGRGETLLRIIEQQLEENEFL